MATQEPQGLTFPCLYAIKAMGLAQDDFISLATSIVRAHVGAVPENAVTSRPSANGKYCSVTIEVHVTHREQLEAIYADLRAHERVLMTL